MNEMCGSSCMLQKDDILQRREEESGNKSKKYTASKEQSSNCHKKYDSIVLRSRLVKTEKGSIYIHKILYVVRKYFSFLFTKDGGHEISNEAWRGS